MTGLLIGLGLGGLFAIVRETRTAIRQWRQDRDAEMVERRWLHNELRERGYDVTPRVTRHGPLVIGTAWDRSLAQLHAQEFAEADSE